MAKAKKCDVCGKFYEMYNVRQDSRKPNGFQMLNIDADGRYFSGPTVDCCQECMTSIQNHIESLKKKKGGGKD
jgi:hypothetical protein